MSAKFECKNSFFTSTSRTVAWAFWSNMQNHAEMENVTVVLDGPFQTGTKGRTISAGFVQEWELCDVRLSKRFVITGREPDFELSFAWDFEDEGTGTRMTQTISASGSEEQLTKWAETLQQMKANVPKAITKLADRLDRLGTT